MSSQTPPDNTQPEVVKLKGRVPTKRQLEVLYMLYAAKQAGVEPPTITQIAKRLRKTKQAVHQHLRLLVKKGVVEYPEGRFDKVRINVIPKSFLKNKAKLQALGRSLKEK